MSQTPMFYRNKKKGTYYYVANEAIDCTNERDGLVVIIYSSCLDGGVFVREKSEFHEKFEEVTEDEVLKFIRSQK